MRRRYMGIKSHTLFDINNYFTIEALDDDLSVVFTNDVEFGIDGIGWQKLLANTNSPTINKGQTISFRANIIPLEFGGIGQFFINKLCNLSGNIMSLLWKGNLARYAFYNLFKDCAAIKSADRLVLPATTLVDSCYGYMFYNCNKLTTAPKLPATTLAYSCYKSMFYNCWSLTTAPELPATTLAGQCYNDMFYNCRSLTTAPKLPATNLANNCYNSMFWGCTKLTTAPELPATTLAPYCYEYMFYDCDSLTTAPELPATTLANNCYYEMFYYCNKLNYIKMLATDISANNCLFNWVYNVAKSGTFVKNPAMTTLPTGVSGIPSGWTVVNDGEESGGSSLTFPVTLVEGDNGQLGIDVYNYLSEKYSLGVNFTEELYFKGTSYSVFDGRITQIIGSGPNVLTLLPQNHLSVANIHLYSNGVVALNIYG